jgi:hypothetical protein
MLSRNRVIEFNFSKDILTTNQLNWDLSIRERNRPDTLIIIQTTKANGNTYLYLKNLNDKTNQILVYTFNTIHPNEQMILAVNGASKPFTDTSSIEKYIAGDIDKKYGIILYSEKEIKQLKQQKSTSEMTVPDFKTYVDNVLKYRAELDSLSNSPNAPDDLLYYGYSIIRDMIGKLGYNPLVTTEEYENFIKRFQDNPETRAIASKLIE